MNSNLKFEYDVRIPDALIQQMMEGEITAAMLLTMCVLYKWANWSTGEVRRVCASSMCYATGKAYSERTFSECLRKLEWMRWITRHMVTGSTKWYRVTIHNYKTTDDAGKVHIINPSDIDVYDKFPEGRCDEASDERSDEGSWEGSDEGSDRHESEHEPEPKSENESSLEPDGVSKSVSQQAGDSGLRPSSSSEDQEETSTPTELPSEGKPRTIQLGTKEPHEYAWYNDLHEGFGVMSTINGSAQTWSNLDQALTYFGWSGDKLKGCIRWAMKHKFWKTRIVGFKSLSDACLRCIVVEEQGGSGEKGLMPQYQRYLNHKKNDGEYADPSGGGAIL